MKKLKTVTVGIPAHNESNNIGNIIRDILNQDTDNFILEKVIVVNDGSTDNTVEIVRKLSKKKKIVTLLNDNKRLGKSQRLNELYTMCTSDIYVTFDADIKLGDKKVLSHLVKQFDNPKVGLVGGSNLPLPPKNFFEQVVIAWFDVWNEVRSNLNNGITVHNHLGCISAMSKNVYTKIRIPKNMIADDDYIYFSVVKLNYTFAYAKDAKVYFRTASNLRDFLKQHSRFLTLKDTVIEYFGDWTHEQYIVPRSKKINSLITVFLKKPILLSLSICLQCLLFLFIKVHKEKYLDGTWKIAKTSKVII